MDDMIALFMKKNDARRKAGIKKGREVKPLPANLVDLAKLAKLAVREHRRDRYVPVSAGFAKKAHFYGQKKITSAADAAKVKKILRLVAKYQGGDHPSFVLARKLARELPSHASRDPLVAEAKKILQM